MDRPNVVFLLADQLRASSLAAYGARHVLTPHLDRLAREGVTFDHAVSTCPLCTPYRAMLLTGRHPQTTGMIMNWVQMRGDEISIADALGHAGYRTGWVGKWHLACGDFPAGDKGGPEYIPEGRDRLGFEYFRAYNYRTQYFDGWICRDDWQVEKWDGYETDGLWAYAREFLEQPDGRPFCLFVSPHQPHNTSFRPFAPEAYYERVADAIELPGNVPEASRPESAEMLRHYLAMTAALDDLLGRILGHLDASGRARDTLVVFGSDHGTAGGAHGLHPWVKKSPFEEVVHVPLVARMPGTLPAGACCGELVAPVDLMPTLCSLCAVKPPRSAEGLDLSAAWRGEAAPASQEALLTMDFTNHPDFAHIQPGDPRERTHYMPWRGARTRTHSYMRWADGRAGLYDLAADPLQLRNLAEDPSAQGLRADMERLLSGLLARRGDAFPPSHAYAAWFDAKRRVVRNAFGPLPGPDEPPDWSLLA